MKNKYFNGLAALGVAAILLVSCGEVPQKEIDVATAAINEAKAAGAELYAPEALVALEDTMKATMAEVDAQQSKLFKNFTASKEQLAAVAKLAADVKQQAEVRKEELKAQIQTTITEVRDLIVANKALILEAPKGKEGTAALQAIGSELSAIETAVNEVDSLVISGEFITGLSKAGAAKEKASAINTELQDVISKYKANVKARRG